MNNPIAELRKRQQEELERQLVQYIVDNPKITLRTIARETMTPAHRIWRLIADHQIEGRKRGAGSLAHAHYPNV